MQENKIVTLKNEEPVTTSFIVAKGIGKKHSSVIKLIRGHEKDLNEFGTCRFEIQKSRGRTAEFCYLNEPQTTLLITLMRNNKIVMEFKKNLLHYLKYIVFLAASCLTGVVAVLLLQRIDKLIGL
jgi:phage regulator Rha-like protein